MERRDQNGNLLGLTAAEADEKLEDLTLPKGAKRAEAKLELMAKWGLQPSFSSSGYVYLCATRGWDNFESKKAERLRDLVCGAIASKLVDFSNSEMDDAVRQALADVLMNEANGKSETARLYYAVLRYAPKSCAAWEAANRLNRAFGLTSPWDVEELRARDEAAYG